MTNTQRNTTVICVLMTIVIGSGYFITHQLKKKFDAINKKNVKMAEEIVKFNKILSMQAKIEKDYTELRLMLAQQSKVIAQIDSPAITYNYLLQVLEWMGRNINFDFSLSSIKEPEATWNEYILSGKADFRDVGFFIKELEYQRALLTIEEITLAATPIEVSDSVVFSVVFRTHYSPDGALLDIVQKKDVPPYQPSFVSFRPRIYDTPPDSDVDPSLIKIDKSKVIGITENRVFIRDDRGVISILSVGDRVAYGYLYAINPSEEKVVFKINLFGSSEDRTLYLAK